MKVALGLSALFLAALAVLISGLATDSAHADERTSRLAGADRFETAVAIAQAAFPDSAPRVYLARADSFADALAASALTDGPILLVPSEGSVPSAVTTEIERLDPDTVVALGGQAAISDAVLSDAAQGRFTDRLSGADRFETAVAIAQAAFPDSAPRVYLARADSFADALAASALTDGPILLVPSCGALPNVVGQAIEALAPDQAVALGGGNAVCDDILGNAADRVGPGVEVDARLSDLPVLSGDLADRVSGRFDGEDQQAYPFQVSGCSESSVTLDLGGDATRVTFMAGMEDRSGQPDLPGVVAVIGDGRLLEHRNLRLGEPRRVDTDVRGVQQLRIMVGRGRACRSGSRDFGIWDDAVAYGPSGEYPHVPEGATPLLHVPSFTTEERYENASTAPYPEEVEGDEKQLSPQITVPRPPTVTPDPLDFDLGRDFDELTAVFAVTDNSRGDFISVDASLQVRLDGGDWETVATTSYGEPVPVTIALDGALQLQVRAVGDLPLETRVTTTLYDAFFE